MSGTIGSLVQTSIITGMFLPYLIVYVWKKATGDMSGRDFWWVVFGGTLVSVALQTMMLLFVFPF